VRRTADDQETERHVRADLQPLHDERTLRREAEKETSATTAAKEGTTMITLITNLPIFFMIIGIILMRWQKVKDWAEVGRILFAAGAFALAFALATKTIAILK